MSERATWKSGSAYSFTIVVFDASDAPVTGLINSAFAKRLARDDVVSAVTVTVTEIDSSNLPGWYKVTYTPSATGHWACVVSHSTYNPRGWQDEIQATTSDLYSLTLDSSGRPGVDWSNIGAPTTVQNLSATSVASTGVVSSTVTADMVRCQGTALASPTGGGLLKVDVEQWTGSAVVSPAAGGYVKVDVEKWVAASPNALVAGRVDASIGDVVAGAVTAAAFAAGALGAVWDELTSGHTTPSTLGALLGSISVAGGNVLADIRAWQGTAAAAAGTNGTAPADLSFWRTRIPSPLSGNSNVEVDVEEWRGATPNVLQTGRVDSYVGAMVANAIGAAQITAGAAQFFADQLLDRAAAVDSFSPRQWARIVGAFVGGTMQPASATPNAATFRALDGSKDRATVTADATGKRLTATLDGS